MIFAVEEPAVSGAGQDAAVAPSSHSVDFRCGRHPSAPFRASSENRALPVICHVGFYLVSVDAAVVPGSPK